MSWMKRRGQPSPNPGNPGIRMYNPNQHSNQQQSYQQWQQPQVQPQYDSNNWYNQPKPAGKTPPPAQTYTQPNAQNYWQQPQQQNFPVQNFAPLNPTYDQYNQPPNHGNYYQNHSFVQPEAYQQNYQQQNVYANQQNSPHSTNMPIMPVNPVHMNQIPANQMPVQESDSDPWNWGWEDNNSNPQPGPQKTVTENFANDESWNWTVEDTGANQNAQNHEQSIQTQRPQHIPEPITSVPQQKVLEPQQFLEKRIPAENVVQESTYEYNTADNSARHHNNPLEQLPNAAVSRIVKSENLTPQWSIESQISQDSSDDILLTSESDNRSNILSRSSTVSHSPSRPESTHDVTQDYGGHSYKFENDLPLKLVENEQSGLSKVTFHKDVVNSEVYTDNSLEHIDKTMEELSLNAQFENKEILTPDVQSQLKEEVKQSIKELTPPPPRSKPISNPLLPPPTLASSDPNKNPYKRSTRLSYSAVNKINASKEPTASGEASLQNIFLQSNQQTPSHSENLGVNLETLPDNSERPDQLPIENVQKTTRKTSSVQQQWVTENCEIAPINDRNQYLETGQLSDADVPAYNQIGDGYDQENSLGTSVDISDSLPPPGLRRLVLGQLEQSETNQFTDNTDEPPPGLSRMVLGQTETDPNINSNSDIFNSNLEDFSSSNPEEPPAGLHRMVPGESSSPESSSYPRYSISQDAVAFQPSHFDDDNYASETELNQMSVTLVSQRSATIGADTPPASGQQTATTAGYSSSSSGEPIISRVGAVGIDSEHRETDLDGANTLDESIPSVSSLPPDNNRRDTIDGGPQDELSTVRNQTMGQNPTDMSTSSTTLDKSRKSNRTFTTDSDHEQSKEKHRSSSPNRYEKDRRYYGDRRERPKDRESPDRYRDRKYERRRHNEKRYEDDTDYFSDKERTERRQREEREEYERRYSSLRRDKDKDKRRREYNRGDDRRGEYFYRYDDDYYNRDPNRSRPSSRSDSVHDSYRERTHRHERDLDRSTHHRDKDREKERKPRDPYNPYYQGYNYDPYNPYYQQYQYQYYENLRRTNPQAYAEWYRKYYQTQGATQGYNTEDRASVHSGRSSANGDMIKDRMDHTDSSMILEDTNVASQRLTPAKFSTAHVKGSISSGHLLKILPHYPVDGQPAILEIISIQSLLQDDEEMKELSEFPGPLVKGVTHKKTVIDYCENKIKKAVTSSNIQDIDSYVLMWELLILLLRQNGMVVGTDIAELLMKNRSCESSRRQSVSSASSAQVDAVGDFIDHSARVSPSIHQYKDDSVTDKFREYLIYGSGKEALEWAMKHGLWGHALFLASKLDKRTYANVMMRFANGLTMNDPLQTLYQLLSGRQPAAVTSVADEKWGDWRPHLAMILSNTSQRPELDRKAITTLGDTLISRGSVYAAQFCYLMAQVEFGRYDSPNAKIVLLGSSHHKPFNAFATNDAIFMTEIYEYACSLSDASFAIPEFLPLKYLVCTRIVDHGLLEKGLLYLERIADGIQQNPTRVQSSIVSQVCQLADRLKYCDPIQDEDLDNRGADSVWLSNLKTVLNDFDMGLISHQSMKNLSISEAELSQDIKPVLLDQQLITEQQWQQQQPIDNYYQPNDQQNIDYAQQPMTYQDMGTLHKQNDEMQEQTYWNQQQQPQTWDDNAVPQLVTDEQLQSNYWNTQQVEEIAQPQITMANQSKNTYDDLEGKEDSINQPQAVSAKSKPATNLAKQQASTGWFGGIWSKLALRPKNQMKLPDDKNPTIVWDSEKKRWVNLEADGDEVSTEIKPPPKMSDMYHISKPNLTPSPPTNYQNTMLPTNSGSMSLPAMETVPVASFAPPVENKENDGPKSLSAQPNMFKLRRGRNIKNAYVDVFNPSGAKTVTGNVPSAQEVFGVVPSVGSQMNYFVPAPISDPNAPADFLTTTAAPVEDSTQQVSGGGPLMYNPNEFSNNAGIGRNH